ncbi:MAG TPA: ATP-dependent RNA helicase RhlB [Acidiferrobacteraceae bacterium]|nr:ATP-dependent RNA helicase RhlB [Acidiferrobacteraceae bacterium]
MSNQHLSNTLFSDLGLPEVLQKGIEAAGFTYCTEIQSQALPIALAGGDVAGQAQTGTGKSAAFLLALYNRLCTDPGPQGRRLTQPRAMIIAPTRELAIQIHKDALQLGQFTDFKLGLVYGGTGYDQQRKMLEQGVDVIIGTPGRTIDFLKQGLFDLKAIGVFVLDEADRMFDLGFIKDIRYLMNRMPAPTERLSMLFSATLSYRVTELAYEHMNNPNPIKVDPDRVTVESIREVVYYPSNEEKVPLLITLLRQFGAARSMVFVNTKHVGEKVWSWLEGNDFKVGVLSGDVPQLKRERLLQGFKEGELEILVATDVAARGLHIPDVSHVFNYDMPQDAEDYVHRIGRTARAGASGDAVSFACEEYAYSLLEIHDYIGHEIPTEHIDHDNLVIPKPPVKIDRPLRRGRGVGGGRSGARGAERGRPQRSSSHHRPASSTPVQTAPSRSKQAPPVTPKTGPARPPTQETAPPRSAEPSNSTGANKAKPRSRRPEPPVIG